MSLTAAVIRDLPLTHVAELKRFESAAKSELATLSSVIQAGLDNRHAIGDPKRYPLNWVFCSRRCQDIFHKMYGHWVDAQKNAREVEMIDATDIESASMRSCLRAFGDVAGDIGFDKPLGAYSEQEALQVIDAIVTRYTEAMAAHHEQANYPAVRGLQPAVDDPFADLVSDLPWETT